VRRHWFEPTGECFLPEREMMTGIGLVPVRVPRVRDRGHNDDGSKIRFRSALVPPYLRKAKSVEELLPRLYLKGEEDQKTIRGIVFPTQGRVTSARRWRRFWGRMPRGCRPRPSRA